MAAAVIQKWGNSQGIRIPKYILDSVSFEQGETVEIEAADGKIIIKKASAGKKNISELFADYNGTYIGEGEIDWGKPVGEEIW